MGTFTNSENPDEMPHNVAKRLFDTQMVFLSIFLKKLILKKKNQQATKKA